MKYLITLFSFILLSNAVQASKKPDDVVHLTADVWCPYTCADTDPNLGLMTEVAQKAYAEVGIQSQYVSSSWNRAISAVKTGTHDILLGSNKEQGSDFELFTDYFMYDVTVFAVLSDSNIAISKPSDLTKYRTGKVEEYDYDETGVWEPYIQEHPNVLEVTSVRGEEHLLDLLKRGRIEVAVMNRDVETYYASQKQLKKVRAIEPNISSKLYLGFNRSERGLMLREKFREGLKALIKKDQLAPIYEKYQIPMPEFDIK